MSEIELELFNDMVKIYRETELQCNYKIERFIQKLQDKGAVVTAKEVINNTEVTEGFIRLWECKRLDLSIEALIIEEKYNKLFSKDEIKICLKRLKKYNYKIK